jgi:hypothetical protein
LLHAFADFLRKEAGAGQVRSPLKLKKNSNRMDRIDRIKALRFQISNLK